MNQVVKYQISIASVFIWIGFLLAISFMEAWMKFQAPGITVPLGLGIGKIVFGAMNKVELLLTIIILFCLFTELKYFKYKFIVFSIPVLIVFLQTAWLLPFLDARADMHIQGLEVPKSNLHFLYIAFEVIKLVCLLIFGSFLLKKMGKLSKNEG